MNPFWLMVPLLLIATWIDLCKHRIPNWLSLGGVVLALVVQALAHGWQGLAIGLGGWIGGFLLLLPFYLARGMGAGDVKLMAMSGSFLGLQQTIHAVAATLIAGGALGLAVLIARGGCGHFFKRYLAIVKLLFYSGHLSASVATQHESARLRFPYAAAIAVGSLYVLWQQPVLDIG